MEQYIDFTNCEKSGIQYSGSEKKLGIIYQGEYYMLKFRKDVNERKTYNHISEYLSSHIMELAGLDVHQTVLGTYQYEEVVKDFIAGTGFSLTEFALGGDSSYDTERQEHTAYTYDEILYLVQKHIKISDPEEIVRRFWEMFVLDALLANFDRHGYNWGFIKNGIYRLAPVYDNGSSLFPRLQDDEIQAILDSREEMDKRTYTFPTSQIKINNKKSSYFEVVQSHMFEECDRAAERVFGVLDFTKVDALISEIVSISDVRKRFYKEMIAYRYKHIFNFIMESI